MGTVPSPTRRRPELAPVSPCYFCGCSGEDRKVRGNPENSPVSTFSPARQGSRSPRSPRGRIKGEEKVPSGMRHIVQKLKQQQLGDDSEGNAPNFTVFGTPI